VPVGETFGPAHTSHRSSGVETVSFRAGGETLPSLDRGVAVAVALSTGEMTSPAGRSRKESERLLRLQRRLARAARGSNRRHKVKTLIAGLKAKDADRRKDWIEKTSTDLARRFDVIRVENLNIKNMTRFAAGTVQNPGRNVAQKAGLNRGILKSVGARSRPGWNTKHPAGSKESQLRTRRRPVTPASTSQRTVARAKRGSCA
jgi:hypothetical protein